MSWPNIDYGAVVQQPKLYFLDSQLQGMTVARERGVPKEVPGANAVVYRIKTGQKDLALRFFTKRPSEGTIERYQVLSERRLRGESAYIPQCYVFPTGLCHGSETFPVVALDWVEGKRLDRFIIDGPSKSDVDQLANGVATLAKKLREDRFAHGDIQMKNLIVTPDSRILLVDLDGVWLPELAHYPPNEVGHRHFQHPQRSEDTIWDESVDAFAFASLYTSLRAIAADWGLLDLCSDQRLVLSSNDYENPTSSTTFFRLATSPDVSVRRLSETLFRWCGDSASLYDSFATFEEATPHAAMMDTPRRRVVRQTVAEGSTIQPPTTLAAVRAASASAAASIASVKPNAVQVVVGRGKSRKLRLLAYGCVSAGVITLLVLLLSQR